MTPEEIAQCMTGTLVSVEGRREAILPSRAVQNHAAFLARLPDGTLACAWFGGTLEGKSDIAIHAALLAPGADAWSPAVQLTDAPDRSEQNPVILVAPDGEVLLFNTAQPAGNQDAARVWMRRLTRNGDALAAAAPRELGLPAGSFIRAPVSLRDDGAWMLPLFRCNPRPGARWTGSHDTAAMALSDDGGATWRVQDVPDSLGSVHMTPVELGPGRMAAFYRRRQADRVHRSESADGGRTWSAPAPTDVANNNASIGAIRLADGRVAMVCNPVSAEMSQDRRASLYDELGAADDRPDDPPDDPPDAGGGCRPVWGVPRAPLTLCLSEDGGRSFPVRHVIEDGPGSCLSNGSLDGRNKELSYPVILQQPDATIELAYTLHRRAIKHVRLDPARIGDPA